MCQGGLSTTGLFAILQWLPLMWRSHFKTKTATSNLQLVVWWSPPLISHYPFHSFQPFLSFFSFVLFLPLLSSLFSIPSVKLLIPTLIFQFPNVLYSAVVPCHSTLYEFHRCTTLYFLTILVIVLSFFCSPLFYYHYDSSIWLFDWDFFKLVTHRCLFISTS